MLMSRMMGEDLRIFSLLMYIPCNSTWWNPTAPRRGVQWKGVRHDWSSVGDLVFALGSSRSRSVMTRSVFETLSRSNSSLVSRSAWSTAEAMVPPMLRTPSWGFKSIMEIMGWDIVPLSSSWVRNEGEEICLSCVDGARPRTLPERPRVSMEALESLQWVKAIGIETLGIGRWTMSVGRSQ